MTILDVAGVYDPSGDHQGLASSTAMRVLDQRATIDATFEPAPRVRPSRRRYETDDTLVDGLVGVRFSQRFARHWGYQMQADVVDRRHRLHVERRSDR